MATSMIEQMKKVAEWNIAAALTSAENLQTGSRQARRW